jgi:hypothetical protein
MDHEEKTVKQYRLPVGWEDMGDISSVDEYATSYMYIDLSNANWMVSNEVVQMDMQFSNDINK